MIRFPDSGHKTMAIAAVVLTPLAIILENLAPAVLIVVLILGGLAFFGNKDFTAKALAIEALGLAAIGVILATFGVFGIFVATGMGFAHVQATDMASAISYFLLYNAAAVLGFILPVLVSFYCAVRYLRKGDYVFSIGAWAVMVVYFVVGLRLLAANSGI